jgi:hypothetical protein
LSDGLAHQGPFPALSQLALDILVIPVMATDCERSFNLSKFDLDIAEAFDGCGNIGETAVPRELDMAWCGEARWYTT